MNRVGWGMIAVLAVLAAAVVAYFSLPADADLRAPLLLGIGALALVAAAYLLVRIASLSIGLWTVGPWVPIIASATTVGTLFLLPPDESRSRILAVIVGFAVALLGWALMAVLASQRSCARDANGRAYALVQERVRQLRVQIESLESDEGRLAPDQVKQARVQLDAVTNRLRKGEEEFDIAWLTGAAYQELWSGIHRAEEWLIGDASVAELRASLLHDRIRIAGSPLNRNLGKELDAVEADLMQAKTDDPPAGAVVRLRLVRRAVNEYRDGRWDGLVRATGRLARSVLITAWTGLGLLLLAIALEASREAIAAGVAFFLVGALVGLIAQLRADAKRDEAVEDYGLAKARLFQTVLASGIAGVAGVVLMAIAADTSARLGAPLMLGDIFDISGNPGQLLVAAVFGLSPQLLIDRLSATAEQYRTQLSATESGGGGGPPQDGES